MLLEPLQTFVEGELAPLALGEPAPLGLLTFLPLNGHTKGKVNSGQTAGFGHRGGLGHDVECRQRQRHSGTA